MKCVATTRKGKSCPIKPDRERDGKWYCHVHDPEGKQVQHHKKKGHRVRVLDEARLRDLENEVVRLSDLVHQLLCEIYGHDWSWLKFEVSGTCEACGADYAEMKMEEAGIPF